MENAMYNVKNISDTTIAYSIPDMNNLRRVFSPREIKQISGDELEKLTYIPGGTTILRKYLQVDKAVMDNLGIPNEPEDFMSEEQIVDLLQNGSLDALLDALDFAKEGVLELIKKFAVELPLNDVAKRDAIKKKLGFDVTAVIALKEEEKATSGTAEVARPERRVKAQAEETGRRTAPPKYNIVSK